MSRISFIKFRNKFAISSKLSRNQIAVLAPIIYRLPEKYFNACEEYLDSGAETNLSFDEYSTEMIKTTMACSYIEALVILHNMEQLPNEACYIYCPRIVE